MDLSALGLSNTGLIIAATLLVVGFWEQFRPERKAAMPAGQRWFANFALYAISIAVTAALGLLLGDEAAAMIPRLPLDADHVGPVAHSALVVLAMDLAHYWLHRLFHAQLWSVHAVHHTDPDVDVTTALRHHPLELVPATAVTVFVAGLLGASAAELAVYGVLAFMVQVPAHANVALPRWLAAALQYVIVTPAFHRVHHSRDIRECHANYGQVFTFWDRLFGTAVAPSGVGPTAYGVAEYSTPRFQRLGTILMQPLLRPDRAGASVATHGEAPARPARAAAPPRRTGSSGRAEAQRALSRRRNKAPRQHPGG